MLNLGRAPRAKKHFLEPNLEHAEVRTGMLEILARCASQLEEAQLAIQRLRNVPNLEDLLHCSPEEKEKWNQEFADEHELEGWWDRFNSFGILKN